jgi:hypothetical protein
MPQRLDWYWVGNRMGDRVPEVSMTDPKSNVHYRFAYVVGVDHSGFTLKCAHERRDSRRYTLDVSGRDRQHKLDLSQSTSSTN